MIDLQRYTDSVQMLPTVVIDPTFYEQADDGTLPMLDWYQLALVGSGASTDVGIISYLREPTTTVRSATRGSVSALHVAALLALGTGGAFHSAPVSPLPSGPATAMVAFPGPRHAKRSAASASRIDDGDTPTTNAPIPPFEIRGKQSASDSDQRSAGSQALVHVGAPGRLASAQAKLSLSITDIAYVLGVSRPTIYSWLSGATPRGTGAKRLAALASATSLWIDQGGETLGNYLHSYLEDGGSIRSLLRTYVRASSHSVDLAKTALVRAFSVIHTEQRYREDANAMLASTWGGDSRPIAEIVESYNGKEDDPIDTRRRVLMTSQRARTRG